MRARGVPRTRDVVPGSVSHTKKQLLSPDLAIYDTSCDRPVSTTRNHIPVTLWDNTGIVVFQEGQWLLTLRMPMKAMSTKGRAAGRWAHLNIKGLAEQAATYVAHMVFRDLEYVQTFLLDGVWGLQVCGAHCQTCQARFLVLGRWEQGLRFFCTTLSVQKVGKRHHWGLNK